MMFEVGRVCVKLAGREAGSKCVIIERVGDNFVLIDGLVRRRRCNVKHLMPLEYELEVSKGVATKDVVNALVKAGLIEEPVEKKSKPKKAKTPRPKKQRKVKPKVEKKPAVKKVVKKPAVKKVVKKPAVKKVVKKPAKK